jgi:hypothetical protein
LGISTTTVIRRLEKAERAGLIPPLAKAKPAPQQETKPFALVTWLPNESMAMARPRYFATKLEALDAAPADAVFSVVDITSKPSRRRRSEVDDILRQGRGVMRNPYPQYRTRNTL